ncbi:hypothetical protein XENOCAPTIV_002016, partial [Xenoophorus captivus]
HQSYETRALLCCYHAANWYYYKYTVDGINVFAVKVKFATAISSIIPLSYYIGMGIARKMVRCSATTSKSVVTNKLLSLTECVLVRPLVYTVSALLPAAYIIGLIFTLKTHSHIYNIHVGEGQGWCLHLGMLRRFPVTSNATVLTLSTSLLLQYFIGVTVLAMVPEIPEIVNGIQFALQNNISLR